MLFRSVDRPEVEGEDAHPVLVQAPLEHVHRAARAHEAVDEQDRRVVLAHRLEEGLAADAVAAREVAQQPGLKLEGLMTVGAAVEQPEAARPGFAMLARLRDETQQALGVALPELSMGMSGDYEVAVEEGATMVRIGTALFGARMPQGDATCS